MAVYLDNMQAGFGNMIMCHMAADTTQELLDMAKSIGVQAKWIQHPGTWKEHFDICQSKRKLAIANGAIEISQRDLALKLNSKKARPIYI